MSSAVEVPFKKSCLWVINDLEVGGAQLHLISVLNNLGSDFKSTLVVLSDTATLKNRIRADVRLILINRRTRCDVTPVRRLAELLGREPYDALLSVNLFANLMLALAKRRAGTRTPSTVILHSTKPADFVDMILRNVVFSRFVRSRDRLIAVCDSQATYLSRLLMIPKQRFRVIYNGIDENWFTLAPKGFDVAAFKKRLSIPAHGLLILQVATFRKEKAHSDAINALAMFHSIFSSKPYLVFVGGGDAQTVARLMEIASRKKVSQYVIFAGNQQDVLPFYWSADLFTLTSTSIETFPLSALEALSTGLAVVLTDVGGAREMIRQGENGYLVRPSDPLALAHAWNSALSGGLELGRREIRKTVTFKYTERQMVNSFGEFLNGSTEC